MQEFHYKISLIIPTRNRPSTLNHLLESLKNYGWLSRSDIEVIIVDNAANDFSTYKLCSLYENIKYLCIREPGQRNALNYGIMLAKGRLMAFVDDDVLITSSNWLDKMASHFDEHPNLGYVSGNVKALEKVTYAQQIWEAKGGLSKGDKSAYWSNSSLKSNFCNQVWPLFSIIAGANSMIPKEVFLKIGLFNTLFDPGAPIPHGGSLEIGYRIIKGEYDLMYDHECVVLHQHPKEKWKLRKKLFTYGAGATALHMYLFFIYKDIRSLKYSLFGHILGILRNFPASVSGVYPLPISYLIFSLIGSIWGLVLLLINFPKIFSNKSSYQIDGIHCIS